MLRDAINYGVYTCTTECDRRLTDKTQPTINPVTCPTHYVTHLIFSLVGAWGVLSLGSNNVALRVLSGRSVATSAPHRRSSSAACCGGCRRYRWWPLRRGSPTRWRRRAGRAPGRRTGELTVRHRGAVWVRWSVSVTGWWRVQPRLALRSALVLLATLTSTSNTVVTLSVKHTVIIRSFCSMQ